jgi:DNA polymerase elongation subunit (family B)
VYRHATYDSLNHVIRLATWSERGERVTVSRTYYPYLYVETGEETNEKSLYNTKLKKKTFNSSKERRNFVEKDNNDRVFHNFTCSQQFLIDKFSGEIDNPDFVKHPLKIFYLDIETYSPDEFPEPFVAKAPVNIITVYDNLSEKFYSFGLKEYPSTENIIYKFCKTEQELLESFLQFLQKDYPDIVTSWNGEVFDIPYLVHRINRVLGENQANRLSPYNNLIAKEIFTKFGKKAEKFYIEGIANLDYMNVYKKFSPVQRESYSLGSISALELGETKTEYEESNLSSLADKNWKLFVDYNIQDVNLLVKLEEKLHYLSILRSLSHVGLTNLETAMSTISIVAGAVAIQAKKNNKFIPTFPHQLDDDATIEGAFVSEPQRGFHDSVINFDANSLYPNLIRTCNMSPETKIGNVREENGKIIINFVSGKQHEISKEKYNKFKTKQELAETKIGTLFSQKQEGLVPQIIEENYKKRMDIKKEMNKLKRELLKLEKNSPEWREKKKRESILNNKQYALKILMNSIYGAFANNYFFLSDRDIARSITVTGQSVIKKGGEIIEEFFEKMGIDKESLIKNSPMVYGDTDSCHVSVQRLLEKYNIKLLKKDKSLNPEAEKIISTLEKYINQKISDWAMKELNSKNPTLEFKRESICDVAIYIQKKRYVLHVIDEEGVPCDKTKYTGIEVVRSTMTKEVKEFNKKIIETMMQTRDPSQTNILMEKIYEDFQTKNENEISFVVGIKNYEKYADSCNELTTIKSMPVHVKAAYFYNYFVKKMKLDGKYEKITSGDKIQYYYVQQPNKFALSVMAFKNRFPEELKEIFPMDKEKQFEKLVLETMRKIFEPVGWEIREPGKMNYANLELLFTDD